MALNTRVSVALANIELNAAAPEFNNGYIRLYDGAQPATPETAVGAQVLIAELRFGATAFPAASGGVLTANAITNDAAANATGTPTWCRLLKSDGTTALTDGTVGTSGANINLNAVPVQQNAVVSITSLTLTLPIQGA